MDTSKATARPCEHLYIWGDGNCIACGVLATTMPGHVEGFHKVVVPLSKFQSHVERMRGSLECCIRTLEIITKTFPAPTALAVIDKARAALGAKQ